MEWISVKDRLPDSSALVLIAYKAEQPRRRYSVITCRYSGGAWRFLTAKQQTRHVDRITHWMPLPKGPALQEEA